MEHAAPEAFWVDKTKCSHTDENGRIQNPTLNPCAEGISAVKAIAIAQAEGQKIYTINKQNAQTALQKLPIGGEVGSEIRNAVNAGKEVTVHEKSINKHGWKGFGYIVIDPETGAGAYIIEGSGNGGDMGIEFGFMAALGLVSIIGAGLGFSALFALLITIITIWTSMMLFFMTNEPCGNISDDASFYLVTAATLISGAAGLAGKYGMAFMTTIAGWIFPTAITSAFAASCRK